MRPGVHSYYLEIARSVSRRATCIRRRYGAVIVNDSHIVATGYCGAPRGCINCCDIGTCLRQENGVPSGERYELCRSVHAEVNAIIHAGRERCLGATLYLVGEDAKSGELVDAEPCAMCRRVMLNAGIAQVVSLGNGAIRGASVTPQWIARIEDGWPTWGWEEPCDA
jgi:dCMP deaminase